MTSFADKIPANLVSGLPEDPTTALVLFGDRLEGLSQTTDLSGLEWSVLRASAHSFIAMNSVKANIKIKLADPSKTSDFNCVEFIIQQIQEFKRKHLEDIAISKVREIISIESKIRSGETFGIASLASEDKEKIRFHLNNAKDIVISSVLSDRKKNAILERISDALSELDTIGTRTDRFFVLMGDAAFVLGEMAEKAKPFTTEVKEVLKIIFRRREDTEGVRLPRQDDQLLLPGESEE